MELPSLVHIAEGVDLVSLPLSGSSLASVNAYLLHSGDTSVLVDCGWSTDEGLAALSDSLDAIGVSLTGIQSLLVTHYHADHYGLAARLVAAASMQLLMHAADWDAAQAVFADPVLVESERVEWLAQHGWASSSLEDDVLTRLRQVQLVCPNTFVRDGDELRVGRMRWTVMATPGHTPGHVCLYEAERGLFISGDHVLDPITPHIGLARAGSQHPLATYLDSLRRIARLKVELVLPAHGSPFVGFERRIGELLSHHENRIAEIAEGLNAGPATATQLCEHVRWTGTAIPFARLSALQQRMAVAETIAHLDELCLRGRTAMFTDEGLTRYALASGRGDDEMEKPDDN